MRPPPRQAEQAVISAHLRIGMARLRMPPWAKPLKTRFRATLATTSNPQAKAVTARAGVIARGTATSHPLPRMRTPRRPTNRVTNAHRTHRAGRTPRATTNRDNNSPISSKGPRRGLPGGRITATGTAPGKQQQQSQQQQRPRSQGPGICYNFRDNGICTRPNCPYQHGRRNQVMQSAPPASAPAALAVPAPPGLRRSRKRPSSLRPAFLPASLLRTPLPTPQFRRSAGLGGV